MILALPRPASYRDVVHQLWPVLPFVWLAASCGGSDPSSPAKGPGKSDPASSSAPLATAIAEARIAEAGCVACHAADGELGERLAPVPARGLAEGTPFAADGMAAWLADRHPGGGVATAEEALDLAHFVSSRRASRALESAEVAAGTIDLGGRLWTAMACTACHGVDGILELHRRADHRGVVARLTDSERMPASIPHDFRLDDGEAQALAAWLLREQAVDRSEAPTDPGLAWEVFDMPIENGDLPDLSEVAPADAGMATAVDLEPVGNRRTNYALRFRGELQIPRSGDWGFTLGSDDGSWLFVDGELVVDNGGLKPTKRVSGSASLAAGWHPIEIVFTQAGGGAKLEFFLTPPGGAGLETVPPDHLSTATVTLRPAATTPADPERIARGESLATARHCAACHGAPNAPATPPARSWADAAQAARGGAQCSARPQPSGIEAALAAELPDRTASADLAFALRRNLCIQCHARTLPGTTAGLRSVAANRIEEIEDIGDEGRIPPNLDGVGARLRREWLEGVLTGENRVRGHYMSARMPHLPAALAAELADMFEAADPVDDEAHAEPAFSAEAAELGRVLAGSGKYTCITCHQVRGLPSLGAQGMDLAVQHERLRPGWFYEWLRAPSEHRPGTRMPTHWQPGAAHADEEIDALRVWMSLGEDLPLPPGSQAKGRGLLLASNGSRPVLHGAFLKDLSARCIAVGTPHGAHYAYDMTNRRLAWLWRGAFVDAAGTWSGRAGALLSPAGDDWVELPEGPAFVDADGAPLTPRLLGCDRDADGYPVVRLSLGDAEVHDTIHPRLTAEGPVLVRKLTAKGGAVTVRVADDNDDKLRATVDGAAVQDIEIGAGATVEVTYQW